MFIGTGMKKQACQRNKKKFLMAEQRVQGVQWQISE